MTDTSQQSTSYAIREPADILVELVAPDGTIVTMPAFGRPTDQEWASDPDAAVEKNARIEDAEIAWIEDNDIRARRFCSADRSLVTIHVVGTSETATCPGGHRWLRLFGEHDDWRQVP